MTPESLDALLKAEQRAEKAELRVKELEAESVEYNKATCILHNERQLANRQIKFLEAIITKALAHMDKFQFYEMPWFWEEEMTDILEGKV